MQGSILDYSVQHNTGIISGDDQNRYQFTGSEWRGRALPARGQRVDFEILGQIQAKDVYLISTPNPFTNQGGQKNRIIAALLAFFLGGFGVHKFYLGRIGWGIVYLIFCWTFIPSIIAFIEFIIYLCTSDEHFTRKYG